MYSWGLLNNGFFALIHIKIPHFSTEDVGSRIWPLYFTSTNSSFTLTKSFTMATSNCKIFFKQEQNNYNENINQQEITERGVPMFKMCTYEAQMIQFSRSNSFTSPSGNHIDSLVVELKLYQCNCGVLYFLSSELLQYE